MVLSCICLQIFSHYSVPLIPKLEGMDEFRGKIVHSHDYREPEEFKDKRVVCLGGAASGQDICLDIAPMAKKVRLVDSNFSSNLLKFSLLGKFVSFGMFYCSYQLIALRMNTV